MNLIKKNRRAFLKNSVLGMAGLTAASALAACSSFDDYLLEDNFNFNDEVLIVGGGIAGLFLAYKLRNIHTEFRLFEASSAFGGRIKSNAGIDYGASVISAKDKMALQLIDELKIQKTALDKENFFLNNGMETLIRELQDRILGLLPYRNFRLRWRLIEISKSGKSFDLVFENPNGVKRFNCRKLALAIPPSQWKSVRGLLELPEMDWATSWLSSLEVENTLKLILPATALPAAAKNLVLSEHEGLNIRQILKKNKAAPLAELDIRFSAKDSLSVEYVYGVLKKKLQISYPFQTLASEQYFDWRDAKYIQGSSFKNSLPVPESRSSHFQILGDFTAASAAHSIEGALMSAQQASERLL